MNKYLPLFLALFLFLTNSLSFCLYAEETLTWSDCIKLAVVNHPDLQSAAEKVTQAKANVGITRSNLLPQVDASAAVSKSKTDTENSTRTTNSYSYGVTGQQLLFDGGKSLYDLKSTQKLLEAADYDYKITSSTVRYNLRSSFIQLLQAQEEIYLSKEILSIRKKNYELVQMRYKAGVENKGSLLTAEANLAQANLDIAQSERNLTMAQYDLTKKMGLKDFKPVKIKSDLTAKPEKQKPDILAIAEKNPSFQKSVSNCESANYDIKSAKMDLSPKINGQLSAERNGEKWPPDNTEVSAGVSMSLNLFQGGNSSYQIEKAKATYNQLLADEKSTLNTVIITLEDTWNSLQNYMETLDVKYKFLHAAEERAQIANAQYSIGSIEFNNWTTIQDNLVSAKTNYLTARINAMTAEAGWIQAKGGTLIYGE